MTCKKFFKEHASLGPVVEAFALTALQTLLEPPPIVPEAAQAPETVVEDVKDMEIEEVANLVAAEPDAAVIGESSASDAQLVPETGEWKDTDAIRYLELYFSLCSKHHDFLDE